MYNNEDMKAIDVIREYRANMTQPTSAWPEMEFDNRAYAIWAADELIVYVLSHMNWTVMRSVESFRYMVSDYSRIVTNYSEANFIFKIAEEVACDVIEILHAMS